MTPSVLTKAKAQLVLQEPFYAAILLQLEVVLTEKVGDRDLWMAATDGAKLYINPKNFEQLSLAKAKGVLKHEVMHVAQMHPFRGEGKEARRWNHATDSAINPIIFDEGGELPDGVLTGAGFKGMTAEQIYAQLPPEPPGQGGGRGNQQNPMDDDVVPAPDKSQAAQDKAKVMISQAASVAAAMGKLPAHVKEALDEILSPKVDWTEYLRTWLTEVSPSDYSFARPNRRFIAGDNPMYLPGMHSNDSMRSLGFMIDTSGSISMDVMKQFLGEAAGAVADVKPSRLVVAYCDAKVQHADVFSEPTEAAVCETLARHGGGGTSMPAGLTWFKRKHADVQAVVVMTDGETPWGEESDYPFPVLWCITNKRITAPWGITLHVDLD